MVEKLAIAAVLVFFVGIGLSVLIAEVLRKRDAREAEQRAAAQRQTTHRNRRSAQVPRRELSPSAAAELAISSHLAQPSRRRS